MLNRLFVILRLASQNLLASKARTFLTILGIIIGIAAVVIVMSVGSSAQALILDQVRNTGSNLVAILPGASKEDGPPAQAFGIVTTTLTNDDLTAIKKKSNVPHLEYAAPYTQGSALVRYGKDSFQTTVIGTTSDFVRVENASVAKGRFLSVQEDAQQSRVIVLGSARAKDLFGDVNPLGKTVSVKDLNFTVIGVMKERGSAGFSSPDSSAYVPIFTAQNVLFGKKYLSYIRGKVDEEKNIMQTKEDIRSLLRDRHDIDYGAEEDFSVRGMETAIGILTNVTNILKYFLVSVAAVALVVGGIGIMNIMLISLQRRVREIGLRKALGAMHRDIVFQVIVESVFIALIGSIFGIIFGALITFVAAAIIQKLGYAWTFLIAPSSIVAAVLVSIAIGILAGLYPARFGARVSPTEALRYE